MNLFLQLREEIHEAGRQSNKPRLFNLLDRLAASQPPTPADHFSKDLGVAILRGDNEVAEIFLRHGVPIDGHEVFVAVFRNDRAALARMLRFGWPIDRDCALTSSWTSALDLAYEYERLEIVTDLLAAGANPNLEDAKGRTRFSLVVKKGTPAMYDVFTSSGKVDYTKGYLLHFALLRQNGSCHVEWVLTDLIGKGAPINAFAEETLLDIEDGAIWAPGSPLHLAVARGNHSAVKVLLQLGAENQRRPGDGLRPVDLARTDPLMMIFFGLDALFDD